MPLRTRRRRVSEAPVSRTLGGSRRRLRARPRRTGPRLRRTPMHH